MRTKRTESVIETLGVGAGHARAVRPYGGEVGVASLWRLVRNWIALRLEVQRQRRDLGALTPRELKDIGVTPEQARRESRKPVWRA